MKPEALREAGHTDVRRGVARGITFVFLTLLLGVAVVEATREFRRGAASSWSSLKDAPGRALRTLREEGVVAANRTLKAAIGDFETAIDESSTVRDAARAKIQGFLTRRLNTGNEQVVRGRKGWLYFRPAVDHLTGPGFLQAHSEGPVEAIADFAAQLAERGIGLVVVPTPGKAAIHPEGLSSLGTDSLPLQNRSFRQFLARLSDHEVPVFAPSERLSRLRREKGVAQFLRTDSHWTPQAMESAAEELATFVRRHVAFPEGRGASYSRGEAWLRGRGDLVALLGLPAGRDLYPPETVRTQPVFRADGQPWSPDPQADILVLGDSFTNMYSQEELGFGGSAGFAEQLSYFLGRPVDKLAINAGGPIALRKRLAADQAAGNDRLAGKRLVIYQFAERGLSSGEWGLVDLSAREVGLATAAAVRVRRPEDPLPARGFAVWESNRSGSWRIWSRKLEGSAARQISPDEPGLQHCCAHLSPDGSQVAYLSRAVPNDQYPEREVAGELRVLRIDGSSERAVAEARPYGWGNRAVVWRDNRELVYIGADGRTFLLDTVSGRSKTLIDEPAGMLAWLLDAGLRRAVNGSPNFSPYDAEALGVRAGERQPGCEPYFSHDGRFGFWVARAGGPVRWTEFATGRGGVLLDNLDPRIPGAQRYAYFPMLSRDSRMLAFGASAGDHDHFRSNYDIFVAPLTPATLAMVGRPQRLTSHPAVDRYPDVHVQSLDEGRWAKDAPPVPLADAGTPVAVVAAGPLEVRATLRACSRPPSLREISPYREALMVCEWEVVAVMAGDKPGGHLRVAHWGLRNGERQEITFMAPGTARSLRLEPLRSAAQTEGYPVFDTLPRAPAAPPYYSREPSP